LEPTDSELVDRLRRGDHEAFERLYRRHRERLYRHAFVQTGGRAAVAEEVVHDVFLGLFSGRAAPADHVGGYLLTSVRNRALNACQRREARGDQVSLEGVRELVAGSPATSPEPPEAARRREEATLLAEALLALRPEQREVVLLRSFEELPWREVARLTGVSIPTASTRYRAALERLRTSCRSLSHAS